MKQNMLPSEGEPGALHPPPGRVRRGGWKNLAFGRKLRYTDCNLTERERGAWKNIVALCAEG